MTEFVNAANYFRDQQQTFLLLQPSLKRDSKIVALNAVIKATPLQTLKKTEE